MSRRLAAAAAALALAACLHPRAPQPTAAEGEWAIARDRATRRFILYDNLNHKATGTATHLSLEVREARARRLAVWFGWTPQELADRLAQERKAAAEGEEFVLSFYTSEPKSNDLDAPRSVWRVAVRVEGADVLAKDVNALERDATNLGLYPYMGAFDVLYQLRFPPAPGGALAGRKFSLEISSALGKMPFDYAVPNGSLTPQQVVPPP